MCVAVAVTVIMVVIGNCRAVLPDGQLDFLPDQKRVTHPVLAVELDHTIAHPVLVQRLARAVIKRTFVTHVRLLLTHFPRRRELAPHSAVNLLQRLLAGKFAVECDLDPLVVRVHAKLLHLGIFVENP